MRLTYFSFFISAFLHQDLNSQCTPPMAEFCEEANVLCSLDELNGFACQNTSTVPSPCSPLCSQGGVGHNTGWWGFVSQGGTVTITLTIGSCADLQGLEFGLWGDCNCSEEVACRSIPCVPPGSVEVISAHLKACKTYYLWVDGCSGDICDFTLNTSGGVPPSLIPLSFINNDSSQIIEPVCVGACNYRFFVNPQPGTCDPTYAWTLDGDEVGGNSNEIYLNFPDEGNFIICVTAYIGNPNGGSICDQEGPRCATVKVRPIPDKMGLPRVICFEQGHPGGYKWHSQRVFFTEKYRQQFTDSNCCKFDSVVCFTVLDLPEAPDVYYITCNNEPYIDLTGRAWVGCKNQFRVPLPKSTDLYQCDSSILLTSVSVNYDAQLAAKVEKDTITYSPNVKISNPCNVGEVYAFQYNWRLKSDSTNTVLSTDEHFQPSGPGEYIVDVFVKCMIGSDSATCIRSFEENFEELNLLSAPQIQGELDVCPSDTVWVSAQPWQMLPSATFVWEITGGTILSNPDSSAVQIAWNITPGTPGAIKVHYLYQGYSSKVTTVPINTITLLSAGKDITVFGKSARLNGLSLLPGKWSMVSGPFSTTLSDPTNIRSFVDAEAFGIYCFEWLAPLKHCEERDTVCIKFKALTTYDDQEERKKERGDSIHHKLVQRSKIDQETEIRISKITAEMVELDVFPKLKHSCDVEWLDLSGRLIMSAKGIKSLNHSTLQLRCPDMSGIYFLKLDIGQELVILKVMISK